MKKNNRITERLLLACATGIILAMALSYYNNINPELKQTEGNYLQEKAVNLSAPLKTTTLKKIFAKNGYFTDANYVNFITKNLEKKINEEGSPKNLGALNKSAFMIDATEFLKTGSESGELRFMNSLAHLGMDSALYSREKYKPASYPSEVAVQSNKTGIRISGTIQLKDGSGKGVLVKLTELFPTAYYDSLSSGDSSFQTAFLARTDANGNYSFINLKPEGNYSVLPIKPGHEFGIAKGQAAINTNKTFNFKGNTHQLKLLDRTEYRQIKADKILTVRTPDEFLKELIIYLAIFIAAFWLFHIMLSIKNYKSDPFILPLIMFIVGVGIIILYSIQDPLRDEIYGSNMALSSAAVLLVASVFIYFFKSDIINKFYHSHWFDPVHNILPETNKLKSPRGFTWLILSIVLMLLLVFFGTGPEGSGVKVNLFGFQVSELSKILMIVFFAAYFAVNADYFRNIKDNRWLTGNNLLMFALFIFLLAIYAYLGDLGPAVVLCLTFLWFYSFAKNEFFQMIVAAITFGIILLVTAKLTKQYNTNYVAWISLTACLGTLLYAILKKKDESVFFIILIISSFVLLGSLPFSFTQRLADRNSMFSNIWENQLIGGDQVAHGVWALNSGGFTGQGLGKGYSNVMPAYHTDMIIESIGEEIGLLALVALFIAFILLVYRSILAARRTGKAFLFYLVAGVAIATMLQFSLIVAGTLGLIPLTGISVPFLSKGNAGIIVTLLSFVLVIILSNEKGDKLEMEYVKKNFDNVNTYGILSFFTIIVIFTGSLLWYQFKSNKYIVKPALVLNSQGAYQYSYNPRIGIMLKEIEAGNIYDKNGVLLATSDKTTLKSLRSKLIASGANTTSIDDQLNLEQNRYYPFASDLLFWLGDYNKEIAKEESSGYAAEFRHFTLLRGFDVNYTTTQKTSDRFKEHKFLPESKIESELMLYDYSALAPFIKAGKNSLLIDQQNKKKKDIQLSLDIVLNQKLNSIIQNNGEYKKYRTSVVAVNAVTGDVLASASNPAPSYKDVKLIENIDPLEYTEIFNQIFDRRMVVPKDLGITFNSRPGSTVKIIDAFAAMNKYGTGAENFSYFIYPGEVIHQGEPVNEEVNMHEAIVRSSNVYFIKLVNEKNLQAPLFDLYDALGINIINRGGYHFYRPDDYNSQLYFKEWDKFLAKGKNIYNNKNLIGSKKRFYSNYSDIAWGQGELKATPLHLARMSGAIANNGILPAAAFLYKAWNDTAARKINTLNISKQPGIAGRISSFMADQSAKVSAATGLEVHGKTGSPERDKYIVIGNKTVRKRITDAWYTFFVKSPKLGVPVAFAIRIEEIGNSEFAKEMAIDILKQLKNAGYF